MRSPNQRMALTQHSVDHVDLMQVLELKVLGG
jgi:hypothetical protein